MTLLEQARRALDPSAPLRLMIYDRTCRGPGPVPGLSNAWWAGGILYNALGRLDASRGVSTWAEALEWLRDYAPDRPIGEIQFWGHGDWGALWIDDDLLKSDALQPGHREYDRLAALKPRMLAGGESLWWFRSCDTFGTKVGHEFAKAWTRFFGCRAAGHTHQIGFLQSGLHVLAAGDEPNWPEDEGVVAGLRHAGPSSRRAPRTITCLHGEVPQE